MLCSFKKNVSKRLVRVKCQAMNKIMPESVFIVKPHNLK